MVADQVWPTLPLCTGSLHSQLDLVHIFTLQESNGHILPAVQAGGMQLPKKKAKKQSKEVAEPAALPATELASDGAVEVCGHELHEPQADTTAMIAPCMVG